MKPKHRVREAGEAIALVGVLASLVFVGLEIRQNNRIARAAAYQTIGIAISESWLASATNRDLAETIDRVFAADSSSWDPLDLSVTVNYLGSILRLYETTYLQVQEELLPPDALESLGWSTLDEGPFLRHLWPNVRASVTPEFRAYLEAKLELGPGL